MKLVIIGWTFTGRVGKGEYNIAYKATLPDGQEGKLIRKSSFEDIDTLSDEYLSTPNIAEGVRNLLTKFYDRMDLWEEQFDFPTEDEDRNIGEYVIAHKECTELIASY